MVKKMKKISVKTINLAAVFIIFVTNVLAQLPTRPAPAAVENTEDSTLYYVVLFALILGLIAAIGWWYSSKKSKNKNDDVDNSKDNQHGWEHDSVDADKELEWLRKHSKTMGKKAIKKKRYPKDLPQTSKVLNKNKAENLKTNVYDADFEETRKKLDKIKFNKLPINSFTEIIPSKSFDALPISNDEALMSAIEQTQDEFEEDDAIRDLALRILEKFRTRNAVEALSQVALYDLSANLRSKAVMILADFDHESVFETILLACADPTREVRASSAKALFQLTFNRADAWTRITESNDDYRIIQSARAAIESGLVDRSIDRLVHEDYKYAYEAFTLLALLVKAGETKEIFQSLESHRNKNVKLAVLKVLELLRDERILSQMYSYIERNSLPEDLSNAATDVIKSCSMVAA